MTVGLEAERIDVWLEEAAGTKFPCATCTASPRVRSHAGAGVAAPGHLPVPDLRPRPPAPNGLPDGVQGCLRRILLRLLDL